MPRIADTATTEAGAREPQAGTLMVELHYAHDPSIDASELLSAVNAELPATTLVDTGSESLMLAHHGHETRYADGRSAQAMSVVLRPSAEHVADRDRIEFAQSWGFPNAKETLAECSAQLLVVEMFGRALAPAERLEVFRATVAGVCALTTPRAAWWPTSTQVTAPPAVTDPPLMGLLNVRLFQVEDTDGEILMDTLGLETFGLPDLQCRCRGLDPNRLARLLYNAGEYIFERGDIIDDGATVEGFEPEQRWRCEHRPAAVGPARVVIDVDPGPEYG